jgi:hypothetical protein
VEVELDEALARLPHDVDRRPRLGLEEALHLGPVVPCRRNRGRSGGQARRGGQGRGLGPAPPRRPEREAAAQERHEVAAREGPRGGPALLPAGPGVRSERGERASKRGRVRGGLELVVPVMRRGRRGDPVMGRHRQGRAVGHEADEIP